MAPSDFPLILIDGTGHALDDDHPLLTPVYKSCMVCYTPAWRRRCSNCNNVWYCCKEHGNHHLVTHRHSCPSTLTVPYSCGQRKAIVKPLKYYDITTTEPVGRVAGYYFNPRRRRIQLVGIKYRPGGNWSGSQPMGPCPVIGKYFPDDTPQCALLESDGQRDLAEPIAIWYSAKSIKEKRWPNEAVMSLFSPGERPKRSWAGCVVVMKFATSNCYTFVPVTRDDLASLKLYFANYVGVDFIR